ncbi:MAG: hypothetical protein K2I14_03355 [Eubacterium sp.]|nr:hypothetical protein [Eubacterium sp.]
MMIKSVSEYLKEYYLSNGKRIIVTTLRGKQHEICLSDDNKYFYSETGLKQHKLKLDWFDGIVDFIKENGGKLKKGGCHSKAGQGNCTEGTLGYYVATECYGKCDGGSSTDPIFIIAAILENAGICKNERGYIQLSAINIE